MRTISCKIFPENSDVVLIKSSKRQQQNCLALALEHTLRQCNEIKNEHQAHLKRLYKEAECEGYTAGFTLFFEQFIRMLSDYERLQQERLQDLLAALDKNIRAAFKDKDIAQRIIAHVREHCVLQPPLTVIVPRGTVFPEGTDLSTVRFGDYDQITVSGKTASVRFPTELVCQRWLQSLAPDVHISHIAFKKLMTDSFTPTLNRLNRAINENQLNTPVQDNQA